MKKIGLAVVMFLFVLGLALSSFAAREVISGTVDKVDAGKGHLWLKTQAGPREFNFREPAKLKDLKPGDKIEVTIQEDGTGVISGPGNEQKPMPK
jgi:Cu/Ag efflux protein CusF